MEKHIHIIANTHWDREWIRTREQFLVQLVKLMDRLIPLMEKEPTYKFITDGQYVILKDYLEVRPEMTCRVKALMEEGRLRVGPWYTQPLETLITGEAMVRNLYFGIRETSRLGEPMLFSYTVDQFGHASQLPQILSGFGIKDGLSWRGIPDRMPPVFRWEAPSGDAVRMHRSVHGYGEATGLPTEEEDFIEDVDGKKIRRSGLRNRLENIRGLKERNENCDVQFWLNGIDHSWPQENLPEVIQMLRGRFPGWKIEQSTLEEYTEDLLKYYDEKGVEVPTWKGELTHPDEEVLICIGSNRPDHKLRHYEAEHLLEKKAEPLAAMAWLSGCEYPLWATDTAWKYILENHAHDSLGCCSLDPVYEATMQRYSQSITLSDQIKEDSTAYLMSTDEDPWTIWVCTTNSCGREGAFTCEIAIPEDIGELAQFRLTDEDGTEIPCAVLEKYRQKGNRYNAQHGHPDFLVYWIYRLALDPGRLEGFTWKKILVRPGKPADCCRESPLPENVMENRFFHVTVRDNGTLDVRDKRNNRVYRRMLQFTDGGDVGNNYNYAPPMMDEIVTNHCAQARIEKTADTAVYTEITVWYTLNVPKDETEDHTARSPETVPMDLKAVIRLMRDVPRVDVSFSVTNRSRFHQFRVLFPSGADRAVTSFSGQPFDVVERGIGVPEGFNNAKDVNSEHHPMEDFCGVTDDRGGLCIAAQGVYDYECINDAFRTLALTLGRITDMDNNDGDVRPGWHAEKSDLFTTLTWELSIIPVETDWREAYPQILDFTNQPAASFRFAPVEARMPGYQRPAVPSVAGKRFVCVSGRHVYLTGMKHAQEGEMLVLRVLNLSENPEECLISADMIRGSKSFWKLDLMERQEKLLAQADSCRVTLRPCQIITVGIVPEK